MIFEAEKLCVHERTGSAPERCLETREPRSSRTSPASHLIELCKTLEIPSLLKADA
ncbi:hypothetical protein DNTS_018253 [Danionella cerebrum]|uniref:Uncharacterized protein n=1 Tax=Danionella cerebrum TaxID=2873325 RepID=A0A553QJC0_9TELE|nr:hypothetical protein DNTS_018253 [Danionella translucida]